MHKLAMYLKECIVLSYSLISQVIMMRLKIVGSVWLIIAAGLINLRVPRPPCLIGVHC